MPFVLASASPRRRALLAQVGLTPKIEPQGVDETPEPNELPVRYAMRVATAKARSSTSALAVLAADTVVALDGRLMLKAECDADAVETLLQLSGRTHVVHTAVVLRTNDRYHSDLVTTSVRFRDLRRTEIEAYVATGEPRDKAGAYGIQGLGGSLVDHVSGSYTNVVGLPLSETLRLLAMAGIA